MDAKAALRERFRRAREALPEAQRAAASARIAARVLAAPAFTDASTIMVYAAMRGEVDPAAITAAALAASKCVAFPQVDWLSRRLVPVVLRDLGVLRSGRYGVPELPAEHLERVDPATLELVLVPAVAFDRHGYRLGYGGGFYDRLLAELPASTRRWGLAFATQVADDLPHEPHDRRVDAVITELEWMVLESPDA